MRILHIISTLNPEAGGPTESVRILLSFGPIGYTGEVVTLDSPDAPYLKDLKYPVHALGPQTSTYGYSPRLVPWLRANRDRFDGIVVNGLWQYCGLSAFRAIRGHKPYVVFTHGMLDPYFRHAFPLKHLKKWFYWLPAEYWVLRNAYRVLFTCQAEKDLAEKSFWLFRWRPHVVPYGAQAPLGNPEVMKEDFFKKCPEVRGKRYLLYLGRIHHKKGCDLLMEAFVKFSAKDPDLYLVMAGPDQEGWRKELEKIVEAGGVGDKVLWPGLIRGNEKWGAFYGCEAFILPSHQENFGIAVAEALACGKPALLSDKVNIAPEIETDGCGYMELDTLQGTENLLQRWFDTPPEKRAAMGKQGLLSFKTRYDMRENAKSIIRLFDQASKENAAATQKETR
jgi:glycosyltransferase involved in cell wall biosynthesis